MYVNELRITSFAKKTNTNATANPYGKPKAYEGPETTAERTWTEYPEDWLEKRLEAIANGELEDD